MNGNGGAAIGDSQDCAISVQGKHKRSPVGACIANVRFREILALEQQWFSARLRESVRKAVPKIQGSWMNALSIGSQRAARKVDLFLTDSNDFKFRFPQKGIQLLSSLFPKASFNNQGSFNHGGCRDESNGVVCNCCFEFSCIGFVEQNSCQRGSIHYHHRGNPWSSYPMISSGLRSSSTGKAEHLLRIARSLSCRCGDGSFWRSRERRSRSAATTASVTLSPVAAASSCARRSASGSLIIRPTT